MRPRTIGRYTLVERIGGGGMAEVWRAEMHGPRRFRRTVALKLILPERAADRDFARMFLREARLVAQLHHANIVQVYELGETLGQLYLAMEHVDGRDLVAVMRRSDGPLPLGLAVYVAATLARALGHAHALAGDDGAPLGLVHRDVSPSNVMIAFDGTVKLVDFGLAKALSEHTTQTAVGALKGKLPYMAPERVDGAAGDHRADQYSVGVVLHEMLTGKRLFAAASDAALLRQVRAGSVAPPSAKNSAVPAALDEVCRRALAPQPAERFADCHALAEALAALPGFSAAQAATFMQAQFAAERESTAGGAVAAAETGPATAATVAERRARPPARRLWRLVAVSALAATVGVVGVARLAQRRHAAARARDAAAAAAAASPRSAPLTPSPLTPSPLTPSPLTPSPLTPSPPTPSSRAAPPSANAMVDAAARPPHPSAATRAPKRRRPAHGVRSSATARPLDPDNLADPFSR